ncbi:MAG: hypothetical protein OXG78_14490 [Chloroflexi bacterium]|nr:hypothetical protein [Chloroflexota bacterium]
MNNSNSTHSNEQYSPEDRDILLGSLFLYKKVIIAKQFNKICIPLRWQPTKAIMRRAIESEIDRGRLDLDKIHKVLVELEGWGRQQIYLYKFMGGTTLQNQWLDYDWVESNIQDNGMGEVFNITRPITSLNQSPLYTIQYDQAEGRLRFIWVLNRTKVTREELEDPPHPDFTANIDSTALERLILRAYRETLVRDVTSFDWNIKTGDAMIMIRKLRGTKYKDEREKIRAELRKVIPLTDFQRLSISRLINNLRHIEEVVTTKLDLRPLSNANGRLMMSTGNRHDVESDPQYSDILTTHRDRFTGRTAPIRWQLKRNQQIGMYLYAKKEDDHRIAINSQETEEDVRHVLRRIRTYCS